jgi:hypothetical protein
MLVLFAQSTPVPIAKFLHGHIIKTARQQGWDTLANGDLLRVAEEAGFDLLLTADQNLVYQQNLKGRKIALVILGGNRVEQRHESHVANCRRRGLRSTGKPYCG